MVVCRLLVRCHTAGIMASMAGIDTLGMGAMMLHHNHYCKHCDRNFTCRLEAKCLLEFDVSKLHKCQDGLKYRKRMAIMLSNDTGAPCAYGCSRACSHPATGDLEVKPVRAVTPETNAKSLPRPAGEVLQVALANVPSVALAIAHGAVMREFERSGSVAERARDRSEQGAKENR